MGKRVGQFTHEFDPAENGLAAAPTALYGVVLLMAALAYKVLQSTIIAHGGPNATLREAVGRDFKGKFSLVAYATAIPLAYVSPLLSVALYVFMALLWFIPDRRIERHVGHTH